MEILNMNRLITEIHGGSPRLQSWVDDESFEHLRHQIRATRNGDIRRFFYQFPINTLYQKDALYDVCWRFFDEELQVVESGEK